MANRWGNSGKSDRLYFLGLQNHCRWWLQPWNYKTLLGRKVMTNLDSIFKSKDITLPAKVCLVKAIFFPVVMCGCESWTINKAESWRIDAYELWCWRRLLRVPWTARRFNLSILEEISPEYSLKSDAAAETPILWLPETKNWLIGKILMLGKIEGRRQRGRQDEMVRWHYWCDGHELE